MLAPLLSDLDRIAPSFQIHGSQIRVLRTPSDFYETLKVRDSTAVCCFRQAAMLMFAAGQDPKCRAPHLPVHALHWQVGEGACTSRPPGRSGGRVGPGLTPSQITTLQDALRAKPGLKLYILTDALRGTRESPLPSCAALLAPLVDEFGPGRVEIRMYHTPNLTGYRKKYIPKRINEGWGLQHMKLYGVDDEIILSG